MACMLQLYYMLVLIHKAKHFTLRSFYWFVDYKGFKPINQRYLPLWLKRHTDVNMQTDRQTDVHTC